ncbi:MAG: glycosyl transferase [Marinobacter sp. T13-3]|nr:MAG: glycosyl transferase [Marinobacter sp. T13-3]
MEQAVRSVLSQDYKFLKVIVSDDCSSDRTFDLVDGVVSKYEGCHLVKCRKSPKNLGLTAHLNEVMREVDTELVVLAAGDDVSLPDRVTKIVDFYKSAGRPQLIFSNAYKIDKDGNLVGGLGPEKVLPIQDFDEVLRSLDGVGGRIGLYLGATGAWSMSLWNKYGGINYAACWEDVVMGFRAMLEDSYLFIDEPLVKYRVNVGLSSMKSDQMGSVLSLRQQKIKLKRDLALQRLDDLMLSPHANDGFANKLVALQVLEHTFRLSIYQPSFRVLRHFIRSPRISIKVICSELLFFLKFVMKSGFNFTKR